MKRFQFYPLFDEWWKKNKELYGDQASGDWVDDFDSYLASYEGKYDLRGWGLLKRESKNPKRRFFIITPEGNRWLLEDCLKVLSDELKFGDQRQIEALKVMDFFNVLYNEEESARHDGYDAHFYLFDPNGKDQDGEDDDRKDSLGLNKAMSGIFRQLGLFEYDQEGNVIYK